MQASKQTFISLLLGPSVWALHLALIYGVQSTLCGLSAAGRARSDAVLLITAVATAVALALLAASLWRLLPAVRKRLSIQDPGLVRFIEHTAGFLVLLSAIGILWGAITVLLFPACDALR
jgi:hypothetical protein